MLVKHSKRTVRRPCHGCGSTDLYWAHDTDRPTAVSCSSCGASGHWQLINRDGTRHTCSAVPDTSGPDAPVAPSASAPSAEASPSPATPAKRPEPVGGYYPRYVDGTVTDVEILRKMRLSGRHVLLQGPPGTGKTALAESAHGADLQTVVCSADTESADFLGQWTQRPDGTFVWHDGPAVIAAEKGLPLFVDECNLAPPSVLSSSLYPLMDGRGRLTIPANPERGTVTAASGFVVIGAANPNVPGGRFSEALLSRFSLHMTLLTDWSVAGRIGIGNEFVKVAKNLDVKVRNGECDWCPQIRDGIAWRDNAADFSVDFAWRALISSAPEESQPIVASVVSAVAGKELSALTLAGTR